MSGEEPSTGLAAPSDGDEAEDSGTPLDLSLYSKVELVEQLQDPEQRRLMREMMRHFAGAEETEEEDGRGLYHDCGSFLRYLRARKWNLQAAQEMLHNTGRWRKSFHFAEIIAGEYVESIAQENDTGKMYVRGYDKRGRPALYMRPRNENSSDTASMARHLVYCVQRAVSCIDQQAAEGKLQFEPTDPNAGKFVLCVGFADYSLRNMIPISVARETITILQDHYPERLGQAFIFDPPWIVNAFFNAVTPFVDPVTLEKFQFIPEEGEARAARLGKTFDLSMLEPEFGGTAAAPFESHIFVSCKRNGTEFGLDFNEQVEISEQETAQAKLKAMQDGSYPPVSTSGNWKKPSSGPMLQTFWGVSSDSRVLALNRQERGVVRELARVLACEPDDTVEERDGLFDDAGALIRYLRSQVWNPVQAEARIRATARWRKEFGLAAQRAGTYADAIASENASGKMYVRGFDRRGRPIIYIKLKSRDSRRHEDSLRHFTYVLERGVACLEPGLGAGKGARRMGEEPDAEAGQLQQSDGKFTLVVDFAGYASQHRPKLRTVREALNILKDHYPERLGEAYVFRAPAKVRLVWKLFRRCVHQSIYQKVIFVRDSNTQAELLQTVFDKSALERCAGGDVDAAFDSPVFLHRQVNGEVYGTEFEAQQAAQLSAGGGGGLALATRRVCWADDVGAPLKEENEEGGGWTFSLESLFGGSKASLW